MQRVNFFLRINVVVLNVLMVCSATTYASRNYIPARKIGSKSTVITTRMDPPFQSSTKSPRPFVKPDVPLSQSTKTTRNYTVRREVSSYFRKQLAGPYIGLGIGVQMHRHEGKMTDETDQLHKFNTNAQQFGMELSLGWTLSLPNTFFMGLEGGLSPIPVNTSMSISDGATKINIKGQQGFTLAAMLGKHFLDGGAIAYLRLGGEWRKFDVKHQVEDGAIDDTDDSKVAMGWSPGIGVGFWLADYMYTVAEYRTIFYEKFSVKSPNGGRLTLNDQYPRVDMFQVKFILPLNQCFGTRFGTCD